jgi:DNA-binding IclR family transcriptional regulator
MPPSVVCRMNGLVSKVTTMLEVLSDGKWHGVEELQQLTELSENQIQEIAAFLYEYDFVKMDAENKKVRINRCFQDFLTQQ